MGFSAIEIGPGSVQVRAPRWCTGTVQGMGVQVAGTPRAWS